MAQAVVMGGQHDMQIGTDDRSKPQMMTTTIQHRGGDVNSEGDCIENEMHNLKISNSIAPSSGFKPAPKPLKTAYVPPTKVSCYN